MWQNATPERKTNIFSANVICPIANFERGYTFKKTFMKGLVKMADIKAIYRSLTKLVEEIEGLERQAKFNDRSCEFKIEYNVDSSDEVQLFSNLSDILDNLHYVKTAVDYLNKPISKYTVLHKNDYDRYETEEGYEFTCGCSIEYYGIDDYTEHYAWKTSRIEHNGDDYYIVGDRELSLEGLRIRIR